MTIRGEMIHRVQLQTPEFVTNSANEELPDPKWSVVTECWARIKPIGGNEYSQAEQQQAKIVVTIEIWNIKGKTDKIKSDMRFFEPSSGLVFNIENALPTSYQADRIIRCQCIQDESRLFVEDS